MIDFHNHILPSVDDGSKSIDMSISMLQHAYDQGITDVVNTVHLQHPKMEGKDISLKRIEIEIDRLKENLVKNNIDIDIHIGSEVFFLPNLVELIYNILLKHNKYFNKKSKKIINLSSNNRISSTQYTNYPQTSFF